MECLVQISNSCIKGIIFMRKAPIDPGWRFYYWENKSFFKKKKKNVFFPCTTYYNLLYRVSGFQSTPFLKKKEENNKDKEDNKYNWYYFSVIRVLSYQDSSWILIKLHWFCAREGRYKVFSQRVQLSPFGYRISRS